jgi:pectinesterase
VVPTSKPNITLEGEDSTTTIISYALNVQDPIPPNVPPRMNGNGVIVLGDGFRAKNLTFRNSSGDHGQAMALRLQADCASIIHCRLLGWQDTLLTHSGRHYLRDCHIEGRVDFIYGGATCFFENCEILSKNGGNVTAASTPEDHPYGYVFSRCKLIGGGESPTPAYLGRPWRPFASVTFVNCEMGEHVRPEGWHNWGKESNEKTARYGEYDSTGPGANPEKRVAWSKQLTKDEADKLTVQNVLGGTDGWDPTHD